MEPIPDVRVIETFLCRTGEGKIYLSKNYINEGIMFIYIENPNKRNAISGKMMVDFHKCVEELDKYKDIKVVVLSAVGEHFCSGGDLDFAKQNDNPEAGFYMSWWMQDVLIRYRKLPLVTFSLVHGVAIGGGSELSVFSDFIIVTDTTRLGFVHSKMGIITAWGGGTRLVEKIGYRKALEMLCSGKVYNSQECIRLELADKIVSSVNKENEALEFIRHFTTAHSSIISSYKKVVSSAAEKTFEEALQIERNEFYPKWGSPLNKKALNERIKHVRK